MKLILEKPPFGSKRVYRWSDLPSLTETAAYIITDPDQEPRTILVGQHQRQMLEGLLRWPIYAASYCRLSDQVLPLRHEHGVDIECKMYRNDPETGRQRYGVYFLKSKVQLAPMKREVA